MKSMRSYFRLHHHDHCAFCALCIICAPIMAFYMGLMAIFMGVGLWLQPYMMRLNGGRAFQLLLEVMPQWGWTTWLLASGTLQLTTFWVGGYSRFIALISTFTLWIFMTWTTYDAPFTLAPWIYGCLAFKSFITLIAVAWIEGRSVEVNVKEII